jgi:hypothetical protein
MLVSVPFCVLATFISWVVICIVVDPSDVKSIPIVVYDLESNQYSKRNIAVMLLSLIVVVMFSIFPLVQSVLGDIAMVSLCYIVFMFGSGMLSEVLCI